MMKKLKNILLACMLGFLCVCLGGCSSTETKDLTGNISYEIPSDWADCLTSEYSNEHNYLFNNGYFRIVSDGENDDDIWKVIYNLMLNEEDKSAITVKSGEVGTLYKTSYMNYTNYTFYVENMQHICLMDFRLYNGLEEDLGDQIFSAISSISFN